MSIQKILRNRIVIEELKSTLSPFVLIYFLIMNQEKIHELHTPLLSDKCIALNHEQTGKFPKTLITKTRMSLLSERSEKFSS